MTITKAIAKIEKNLNVKVQNEGQKYFAVYKREVISFYQNGRGNEITCINTARVGDVSDSMTDYHAGCFHDNITQAIRFLINY